MVHPSSEDLFEFVLEGRVRFVVGPGPELHEEVGIAAIDVEVGAARGRSEHGEASHPEPVAGVSDVGQTVGDDVVHATGFERDAATTHGGEGVTGHIWGQRS